MRISWPAAALVSLALLAPAGVRGGAVGFKHERSVYADEREAPLVAPEGVACDDRGRLIVSDTGNGRLVTYTWKDGALEGGRELRVAQLAAPGRSQLDSKGRLWVLDRRARRLARVDASGAFLGQLEPKGTAAGAVAVGFKLDGGDNVVLLDAAGRRVLVLDAEGRLTRELALPRSGGEFTDVAVDPAGRIYALDAVVARVWVAEKGAAAFQALTPSLKDRVSFPAFITADGRGKLFLVDQNGNGIVVLGQDGSFQGRELSIGAAEGLVSYPAQLCLTGSGEAYLADRNNNRVQVFTMTR